MVVRRDEMQACRGLYVMTVGQGKGGGGRGEEALPPSGGYGDRPGENDVVFKLRV